MTTKDQIIKKALRAAILYEESVISSYDNCGEDPIWQEDIDNSKKNIKLYQKVLNKMKEKLC